MNDYEEAKNRAREARDAWQRQWGRLRQLEKDAAAAGVAMRREMELCRAPLPIEAEAFSRLASAIAMEFEGATVRQEGDVLVVVAPREDRASTISAVAQ